MLTIDVLYSLCDVDRVNVHRIDVMCMWDNAHNRCTVFYEADKVNALSRSTVNERWAR